MARPTLKSGMSGNKGTELGDAILTIRNFFNLAPAANETNYSYGPQTVARVKTWQSHNGLTPDGEFGPRSWAKFDSVGGAAYGPPTAEQAGAAAAAEIAASNPVPATAHHAAAAIATPRTSSPPSVNSHTSSPAPAPTSIVGKAKAAEHSVAEHIEALYHKIPLWARIGIGAFSGVLTIVGLVKASKK